MSTNQIKIEANLHITEGMDVNTVLQKGSCGQKIAVKLFDFDGNGKLEGNEDDLMNNCVFKSEKGQLTIYDKKSGSVTVLKYDNKEQLLNTHIGTKEKRQNMVPDNAYNSVSINENVLLTNTYKSATIDFRNNKCEFNGLKEVSMNVTEQDANFINSAIFGLTLTKANTTIKNSKVHQISTWGGTLNLNNTTGLVVKGQYSPDKDRVEIENSGTNIKQDEKTWTNIPH